MNRFLLLAALLVSVHVSAKTFIAPTTFEDRDEYKWVNLEDQIRSSPEHEITILWQGTGGRVMNEEDTMRQLGYIEESEKHIVLLVIGPSISAHAVAVCRASHYVMRPGGVLIFHAEFDDYKSRMQRHKVYITDRSYFQECVNKGILTSEEVEQIIVNHLRLEIHANGRRVFKPDWRDY